MKMNRFAVGSMITGAVILAALSFNALVFPLVLTHATAPDTTLVSQTQNIQTKTISQTLTSNFTSHMIPTSDVPDSNYISEEKALALIRAEVDKPYFSTAAMNFITVFKKSTGPAEGAVWQFVFKPTPEEITTVTSCDVLINAINGKLYKITINYESTVSMRVKMDKHIITCITNGKYEDRTYNVVFFDRDEIMTDYKAGLSPEEMIW